MFLLFISCWFICNCNSVINVYFIVAAIKNTDYVVKWSVNIYKNVTVLFSNKSKLNWLIGELTGEKCSYIIMYSLCVLFVTLVNIANIDHLDPIRKRGEMVFCYQNCSDLVWEKIVLVIEKNFEIRGWKPRICKFLRSLEQFVQTVKGQNNFW